jgi:hypothetical protein
MSAPFGPSPKLRDYIDWFRTEVVGTVQEGHASTKSVTRFETDSGYAFIVGHADSEPLSHSEVAYLDRRLGVDAPFPKTPQPYRD